MHHRLIDLLPELAASVSAALRVEGYLALADSLGSQIVEKCTYDPRANAGYRYLVQDAQISDGETPAALTVTFAAPNWFNVDLRASGSVFGIELLSPSQSFEAIATRFQ